MKDEIIDRFTGKERKKREEINSLMTDWKRVVSKKEVYCEEEKTLYTGKDYFCSDGFFPNYFNQNKTRILVIGRETRDMSRGDYITTILDRLQNDDHISIYFRRVLPIIYGIKNNNKIPYGKTPDATAIAKEMVQTNDYGFAAMNISKYSNYGEYGRTANKKLINTCLEHSVTEKRNFIREELEILDPHVILTANLWNANINTKYLEKVFSNKIDNGNYKGKANLYKMLLNGRQIKLIDLFHFSAPNKKDKDDFYTPIMKLLFEGVKK